MLNFACHITCQFHAAYSSIYLACCTLLTFAYIIVIVVKQIIKTKWTNKFRNYLCEDILNKVRNENNDMTLQYSDEVFNEGIIRKHDT